MCRSFPGRTGLVALASLLFLLATHTLSLPEYNMAWGTFSNEGSGVLPELDLSPIRLGTVTGSGVLVLFALFRVIAPAARTLGWSFTLCLLFLLIGSAASLIPRQFFLGHETDANRFLYALRFMALSFLTISGGLLLTELSLTARISRLCNHVTTTARIRRPIVAIVALTALSMLALCFLLLDGIPHAMDEIGQIFQAKIFASGRLWVDPPPIPDLFEQFGVLTEGGKWRSMWLPGQALTMTPFVMTGLLPLYPAVMSAITVWLVFFMVRRSDDRATASVAVLLLLTSPWFWSLGSSYMSHPTAALFFAGFLYFFIQARRASAISAMWAGLLLGASAATRAADTLLLSIPFGLLWLFDYRDASKQRTWLRRTFALTLGVIPGLTFLLANNYIVNGGILVFGYDVLLKGPYRFGLGQKPPGMLLEPLATSVHTFSQGLSNFRGLLTDLQVVLFGLGIPSLSLTLLSAFKGARDGLAITGLSALVLFLTAYTFLPLDLSMFGPRYAYAGLALFVWLGARGLMMVHRRLKLTGKGFAIPGILFAGVLVSLVCSIPSALSSFNRTFAGVDRRLEETLKYRGISEALIVVPEDPRGLHGNLFLYTSAFRLASPDFSGIVPIRAPKGYTVESALDAFPHLPAYVWLAAYQGDLTRFRFVSSALVRIRRPSDREFQFHRETMIRSTIDSYMNFLMNGPWFALWNSLGTLNWLDGDDVAARYQFTRASDLAPEDPVPWINLGLLEQRAGRADAARAAAQKARQLGGTLPPPLVSLLSLHEEPGP